MSVRRTTTRRVQSDALIAELIAALPSLAPRVDPNIGLPVARIKLGGIPDGGTWVDVPDDTDINIVDAVLNRHDPTPPPTPVAPDYGTDSYDLKQVAQAVTAMRAFLANPSPSAAQVVAQVKLIDSVLLALLKRSL